MANNQTPFLKRVLIPFWVLRLLFMLILIGIYGFAIAVIASIDNADDDRLKVSDDDDWESAKSAALGVLGALIFLLLVCFFLDIVAIIMFARRSLRPKIFLIFNVLQCLFWAVMLILAIVGSARASAFGGVILAVIIFLLYLGLLIYASVVYHRDRKGQKHGYKQTPNPAFDAQAPLNASFAYRNASTDGLHGAADGYYNIPPPQHPQTTYSRSTSPAPQQYLPHTYKAGQENVYEMPGRPMY